MRIPCIACLGLIAVSVALQGCNNVDEAKARTGCEKPGAAAADCPAPSKPAVDKNLGGIAKALNQ